jgi:hypothetical protein
MLVTAQMAAPVPDIMDSSGTLNYVEPSHDPCYC